MSKSTDHLVLQRFMFHVEDTLSTQDRFSLVLVCIDVPETCSQSERGSWKRRDEGEEEKR